MAQGPDGVFRAVKPGTSLARISNPAAINAARTTAGAGAGAGLKSLLLRAGAWAAGLSVPGKILLAGAALFGLHKLADRGAPDAAHLAGMHPIPPMI